MDQRVLVVFHGTKPEQIELPPMRRIQFDVLTEQCTEVQPWLGLLRAGQVKRDRELTQSFRYDRCIAVWNHEYKEREFKIMASAYTLNPLIVLSEYAIGGNYRLQRASPYMFSADSMGFARMSEFSRSFEEDPTEFAHLPDDYKFYQHMRAMGYHGLGVV